MKAAAFAYARATSVVNALELLKAYGDRAKVLSGGQSLMPAMNLRLISPELIVDIGELAELRGIAVTDSVVRIGALTRHVDLLTSPDIAAHAPLLTEAIAHVAHPAIRNRGTLGGSLAHADPASELPACMVALNATIIVRGQAGERRVAAEDFFKGIYETDLSAQELLIVGRTAGGAARIPYISSTNSPGGTATTPSPAWRRRRSWKRMSSPICGSSSLPSATGRYWPGPRQNWSTLPSRPRCWRRLPAALGEELDPQDDQQASAAMRRHLAKVLLARGASALLGRPDLNAGGRA